MPFTMYGYVHLRRQIGNILFMYNKHCVKTFPHKTVLLRDRKRRTARAPHLQKCPKCLSNFLTKILSIFCPKLCPFFYQHFCPNLLGGYPRGYPPPSWGVGYPRGRPPSQVGGYPGGAPPVGGYPRGQPPQLGGAPPVGGGTPGGPPVNRQT